jgi:hypothetical protein
MSGIGPAAGIAHQSTSERQLNMIIEQRFANFISGHFMGTRHDRNRITF